MTLVTATPAEAPAAKAAPTQPPDDAIQALHAEFGPDLDIPAPGTALTPEAMAQLDRLLAKLGHLRGEVADVQTVADLRKADIQRWADAQTDTLRRQASYLEAVLLHAAAQIQYRRGKSQKLPHGTLGKRSRQDRLVIEDQAAAVRYSLENGIPVKQEARLQELKEYWQATGEVPAGCRAETDRGDQPIVEVA